MPISISAEGWRRSLAAAASASARDLALRRGRAGGAAGSGRGHAHRLGQRVLGPRTGTEGLDGSMGTTGRSCAAAGISSTCAICCAVPLGIIAVKPLPAMPAYGLSACGELGGGAVPLLRGLLEGLEQRQAEAGGELLAGDALVEGDGRLGDVRLDVFHRRLGVEGELAGEHLVEDDRQRVDVAARVEHLALRLLGRHELRRAEDHALLREHDRAGPQLALGHLGEAEVEHLGVVAQAAVGGEEDVLRLEIAVDDPLEVRLLEGAAALDEDGHRALGRERALLADHLVQVLALQVLHDDVERSVVELAEEEHLDGVGVLQVAHRAGLAAEAGDQVLAVGELGVEDLDRHHPVHRRLGRLVDGIPCPPSRSSARSGTGHRGCRGRCSGLARSWAAENSTRPPRFVYFEEGPWKTRQAMHPAHPARRRAPCSTPPGSATPSSPARAASAGRRGTRSTSPPRWATTPPACARTFAAPRAPSASTPRGSTCSARSTGRSPAR